MGCDGVQDAREARVVRVDATAGGAESSAAVGDRHGKRGGKVAALVNVRKAYFYTPSRSKVLVDLPPEDYQAGDEHMCGLSQCSLYGTRDAAPNWEEELASTLSDLKLTRWRACPCVWQGEDITIGEERSVVEVLIKMISRKYGIKKQAIGEDSDLEKSGRKLNRVIEWDREGITIEADQRHVREILKDFGLKRANHSATLCAWERKDEGGARSDENKGENRCGQGQTQTKHEWDG